MKGADYHILSILVIISSGRFTLVIFSISSNFFVFCASIFLMYNFNFLLSNIFECYKKEKMELIIS